MASVEVVDRGRSAAFHAADYAQLFDLDRAGWAWEWLRRNPEFAALHAETKPSHLLPCGLVVHADQTWERQLLRWGLHYG